MRIRWLYNGILFFFWPGNVHISNVKYILVHRIFERCIWCSSWRPEYFFTLSRKTAFLYTALSQHLIHNPFLKTRVTLKHYSIRLNRIWIHLYKYTVTQLGRYKSLPLKHFLLSSTTNLDISEFQWLLY